MAAYGASRGELNGDGNQNSATDDYLATPDQRCSQSLITEGQRKDDFSRHTMEAPAPCCRTRRVSSSAYVDIRAQIAAIIRKCQHALSYWEGKLKCVSWWWFQYFTAKAAGVLTGQEITNVLRRTQIEVRRKKKGGHDAEWRNCGGCSENHLWIFSSKVSMYCMCVYV